MSGGIDHVNEATRTGRPARCVPFDPDARSPAYLRVALEIRDRIASGGLQPGGRIESERALADRHGISRMTARRALQHLVHQGLVESRGGSGTYVASAALEHRLPLLSGFTEEMLRQNVTASSRVLSIGLAPLDASTAAALGVPSSAPAHRLRRLRLADNVPVAIETSEVPDSLAPGLSRAADFSAVSLYGVLRERYGLVPTRAEQTLVADRADAASAAELGLDEGDPVLRMTRLTRDGDDRAFEHARSVCRGDAFVMRIDLSLGAAR